MFIEAKDDGSGGDNWSYESCNAPVKSSPPTNQHPVFLQVGCPSCRPTNCQSTEWNNITFHGLAYPKLTWGLPTLSLTTNSSWLPWGRVAMPLISPLMLCPPLLFILLLFRCCCSLALAPKNQPRVASVVERIDPLRFLAGCRKRRLNKAVCPVS